MKMVPAFEAESARLDAASYWFHKGLERMRATHLLGLHLALSLVTNFFLAFGIVVVAFTDPHMHLASRVAIIPGYLALGGLALWRLNSLVFKGK